MKTKRRGNNSAAATRQDSCTPPAETGSLLTLDISAMDGAARFRDMKARGSMPNTHAL
jgi:hypothetical protein